MILKIKHEYTCPHCGFVNIRFFSVWNILCSHCHKVFQYKGGKNMSVRIIKEGDTSKQGNAHCPQCKTRVLIGTHWGDPPKCPNCGVPYEHDHTIPKFS